MRRPPLAILLLSLMILGSAVAASALQQPSGRRANARKLLRIADGASQRLIQAGQGRLDRDARSRPFWEALVRMDSQIDRVGAGLRTRDLSFFQALRTGTSSLAELQVTWSLAGVKDPAVDQNLRTLSAAYGRLRNRYGPEWVRFQNGRPLSEDERVRFARMRAEQGYFAGKLEPIRDRAERTGDSATAEELTLLLAQVHGVATASATLGDYLDASVATDSIRGAWYGARATHGAHEEGWAEADQVAADITTDESVGFVFTTDLQAVQDWSFVEEETEIPEEIAQAEEGEERQLAPGRVVDLGPAEEADPGIVVTEPIEEAEETESVAWGEEPAETASEELPEGDVEEPIEETESAEALADSASDAPIEEIEEEDLDVELLPGNLEDCVEGDEACVESTVLPPPPTDELTSPPPAAPANLPMG
jgi:hypothetical protein